MIRIIEIEEGESPIFVSRVEQANGTPISLASITSFDVRVFRLTSATPDSAVYENVGLPGAAGFSDTLLYEYGNLLGDDGGYNFAYVIDNDLYAMSGGNRYRVQVTTYTTSFNNIDRWDVVVGEVF